MKTVPKRKKDGTLVALVVDARRGPKPPQVFNIKTMKMVELPEFWDRITDRQREAWLLANNYQRVTLKDLEKRRFASLSRAPGKP